MRIPGIAAAVSAATVLLAAILAVAAPEPADPPEGFGAVTKGGEGGRVIAVTTLADDGAGSLREALSAQGPRIVRFAVEGTIELKSRLRVTEGRLTLDGASAPGKGITLLNHGIQFREGPKDVIVRHLRIRTLTGAESGDCILLWGNQGTVCERVLVDHCSFMWATDEVVNTWGQVRDVTFQWCIIAEGQEPHGKAWLSGEGSDRITIHHCLLAHNSDRNPKLEGGVYDFVNNVVYNWGNNNGAKIDRGARVNLVNNSCIPGPDTRAAEGCFFPLDPEKGTRLYVSGNVSPRTPAGTEDPWLNVTYYEPTDGKPVKRQPAPDVFRAEKRFDAPPVATQSAKDACELVLERAGAAVRGADGLRGIRDVRERTGRVGRGPHPAP